MRLERPLLVMLLLSTTQAAATTTQLDLGKTGIKATITVPKGTKLEKIVDDSWSLSDPNDFSLNLSTFDMDTVRGMAETKGAATDVYSFKRYVTNTPDFYLIEGKLYGKPTFIFNMKLKFGGKTLFCGTDMNRVYSRALADQQVAACKSIKAK